MEALGDPSHEVHPSMADTPPTTPPALPMTFGSFIVSLYHAALVHLGEFEDPQTGARGPVNLELARQTIDLVEILQNRTAGNLEREESELVTQVLYELRLRYCSAAKCP
jgi:hypothetical protein